MVSTDVRVPHMPLRISVCACLRIVLLAFWNVEREIPVILGVLSYLSPERYIYLSLYKLFFCCRTGRTERSLRKRK